MSKKSIADCSYSAFISYAHADDDLYMGWITQFRDELDRGLRAKLRGVRLPSPHLSGENGPVGGVLSDELTKRVDASFAMIIVVGDNYVQSTWCLKELAYFKQLFGDQGFRDRLYILALSEPAVLKISQSDDWRALMPTDEQVWIPFFNAIEREKCLNVYMGPNVVSPDFQKPFERLRDDFSEKAKQTLKPVAVPAPVPTPPASEPRGSKPAGRQPDAGGSTAVLLGFVPPASAAAAAAAVQALAAKGLPVRALTQDVVFSDFADLVPAERLVLAFDDAPLMMPSMAPGGHLQVQREAWLKKGKSDANISWLDLRQRATLPQDWQGGAAYVATLNVAPVTLEGLIALLRPKPLPVAGAAAGPAGSVKLYIETNDKERFLYVRLGEQIQRKWVAVCGQFAPGRTPPLTLRPTGLPVDMLDSYPSIDDADGVVMLWGQKTGETLLAQINKIENKITYGQAQTPGIVAYLMPPQPTHDAPGAWGWQVLRFNAADDQRIDVIAEEGDELERFLKLVLERRLQRDAATSGMAA